MKDIIREKRKDGKQMYEAELRKRKQMIKV